MLNKIDFSNVQLDSGIFLDRANVNLSYLLELDSMALLQNFYLEAGITMPGLQVLDDPSKCPLHWGWEAPTCQLRGHFLGHWISAASMSLASNKNRQLEAKLLNIIDELEKCQKLNGGKWIASIPEKYFTKLETGDAVWSPQYTVHKTLLGLTDCYRYLKNEKALQIVSRAADWFTQWTNHCQSTNQWAIYRGEAGGMLEVWASLYELTKDTKYFDLAEKYSHPGEFDKLMEGKDCLTNCHENASIPLAHGAAKMYEITGQKKWLEITERFWICATEEREAYCTGGQGAGEFWVPPHLNAKYLGNRNQEFCTVYNMVRLADYLFKFTSEKKYLDYIELNLYNGFLAQQNKNTGMPTYFLPLKKSSFKKWGSKRNDFWCCHGTMVQGQELYPSLIYYADKEKDEIFVSQYISSKAQISLKNASVKIQQNIDMKYYNDQSFFDQNDSSQNSRWVFKFTITSDAEATIKFRKPDWLKDEASFTLNGKEIKPSLENGFYVIKRNWDSETLTLFLNPKLHLSTLPDAKDTSAILEGPIVLAAVNTDEFCLDIPDDDPGKLLSPITEHTYATFPWLQSNYTAFSGKKQIDFIPLYEVTDENYTVYFRH